MARKKRRSKIESQLVVLLVGLIVITIFFQQVPGLLFTIIGIAAAVFLIPKIIRMRKRVAWREKVLMSGINQIDVMKGEHFELYLKALFEQRGYKVELTPKLNDFGADLILTQAGKRIVVQAKRYGKTVGVDAIQQVTGARAYYGAMEALVVTNQEFSSNALLLAETNNVGLINRSGLINLITSTQQSLKGIG